MDMCTEITCEASDFLSVKEEMEKAGVPVQSAEVTMIASSTIPVDLETARKVIRLLEALEDHDDSETVSSNVDIPDDVAAELAKE